MLSTNNNFSYKSRLDHGDLEEESPSQGFDDFISGEDLD